MNYVKTKNVILLPVQLKKKKIGRLIGLDPVFIAYICFDQNRTNEFQPK